MRSPHGGGGKKNKKLARKSNVYLHKLTFGAVFPAAPDTRRLYQTAKGSWSRAAGVIFGGFRGRLSSSFIRVQVNMMMMMVLMMAPERAESPSCRQQEEEKRCFPASARAHTHTMPHHRARNI